ncbi:hypothetical protein BDB01DRAFT_864332 [Pilobolus umbonatus]|nr:hypothetical protein BDB01DRAFT_864332 [Pilobolus umbonatus]
MLSPRYPLLKGVNLQALEPNNSPPALNLKFLCYADDLVVFLKDSEKREYLRSLLIVYGMSLMQK